MLRLITIFLLLVFTLTPISGIAIDFMYKDTRGFRFYSCGANRRGAKVAIKAIGGDRFQILSKPYSGFMHIPPEVMEERWCTGLMGAVRVICGLCPPPNSLGKVEDRKRQLGLEDAE